MKPFESLCATTLLGVSILLSACGGGGEGGGSAVTTPAAPAPTSTPAPVQSFSIGGTITGLGNDGGLALRNGLDFIAISPQATSFTFPQAVAQGGTYAVTLGSPLASGRPCEIINGTGTVTTAAVQSVIVRCDPNPFVPTTPIAPTAPTNPFSTLATGFSNIVGIAVDGAGNVYAANAGTISKTTPAGVTTGLTDPYGLPTRSFAALTHIAADRAGNLYIVDGGTIFKIPPNAFPVFLLQLPDAAQGIAVDSAGTLYLSTNSTVQKLAPSGALTTLAGSASVGNVDGAVADARFYDPRGLAVDTNGNVYVADFGNLAVRKISPQGQVTTLQLGAAVLNKCTGDFACEYSAPTDVAVDASGNLYISAPDFLHYVHGGHSTIFTANRLLQYAADNRVSIVDLGAMGGDHLGGLAVDGAGTVYLADSTSKSIVKARP